MRARHAVGLFSGVVWYGTIYDADFYFVADNGPSPCTKRVFRSAYYAVSVERLMARMTTLGFESGPVAGRRVKLI